MTVRTKTYPAPPISVKEILRYAGVTDADTDVIALLDECLLLCADKLSYKVCYKEFDISFDSNSTDLGFARTESMDIRKNLDGCNKIILFGATLGISLDRLISKYGTISPSKAFMLQAIGSERIEALCNAFNNEIKRSVDTAPRFSAGYGDLPLELQIDIFRELDCSRKIGLTLNESLLMSPTKSVTAIIGIRSSEKCRRPKND